MGRYIVELHEALELPRFLTLGHGLHDLVLQAPGGLVVHSQMAHQLQGRQVVLVAVSPARASHGLRLWAEGRGQPGKRIRRS